MKHTDGRPQTLKAWRHSMKLSQAQAADLFGIHQSLWSKYERGSIPHPHRIKRLATLTGVPVEVLAGVE